MNAARPLLLLLPLFPCLLLADETGTCVSVRPEIIGVDEGAIQNAGCGTEIWHGGPHNGETRLVQTAVSVSDYSVNSMIRVAWYDHEAEEGGYLFAKMDKNFEYCIQYGQKLNIGCFVTSTNRGITIDGGLCAYPAYVHEALQSSEQKDIKYTTSRGNITRWEPNFENPYFFQRYDVLLGAFAEYLEGSQTFDGKTIERKKLVRYIEMRHFGFWGEGAYPKRLVPSNSECLIRFADAFARHFPDIRLLVPTNGMVYSPPTYDTIKDYHFHLLTAKNDVGLFGIFRDNWGWDENLSYVQKLFYEANKYEKDGGKLYELLRDRWKSAPLTGEPLQALPKEGFRPYSHLLDQVTYLHPVVIRNCNVSNGTKSYINPTGYNAFDDPQAMDNFHKMYAIIGYRYLFTSAEIAWQDDKLVIAMDWLNIGLTPTYEEWNVRYLIKDEAGKEIWTGPSSFDLRTLFPDENTPPGVVNADVATTHTDRFTNAPRTGRLYLQITDPSGVSPHMALSIKGRTKDGMYLLTEKPKERGTTRSLSDAREARLGGQQRTHFSFEKRGKLISRPSMMPKPGPYYTTLLKMNQVDRFPYQYALYFSTDHDGGQGGIWLYVSSGAPTDADCWKSYDQAVVDGDFDYLPEKPQANPIFVDSVQGRQTETPHANVIDRTVYMTYHNVGAGHCQSTLLATSSDGVNFTRIGEGKDSVILDYDPKQEVGDGHTGYFRWRPNPFPDLDYKYVGYSLHGGGDDFHGAMWASNDAIRWNKLQIFDSIEGHAVGEDRIVRRRSIDPNTITDLGNGEFVAICSLGHRSSGGRPRTLELYEIFLGSDGKALTREARKVLSNGPPGSYDAEELETPTTVVIGDTWHLIYVGTRDKARENTVLGAVGTLDASAHKSPRLRANEQTRDFHQR